MLLTDCIYASRTGVCMQIFVYEICARVVAVFLLIYCGRSLWHGFAERKIEYTAGDFFDWLNWSNVVVHRDK